MGRAALLWNPDFYYNKAPKPHSKLKVKKAQITLRGKQLSYKLKLGGESDNPTSKGIPQPPLWRKSVRGALSRCWFSPFILSKLFDLTDDPGPGAFRGLLAGVFAGVHFGARRRLVFTIRMHSSSPGSPKVVGRGLLVGARAGVHLSASSAAFFASSSCSSLLIGQHDSFHLLFRHVIVGWWGGMDAVLVRAWHLLPHGSSCSGGGHRVAHGIFRSPRRVACRAV